MVRSKAAAEPGAAAAATAPETPGPSAESQVAEPRQAASADRRASRLPSPIRFPLVAVLSFSFASLAYSFLNVRSGGQLVGIARQPESGREAALLLAWRLSELALGWYGSYDSYDLAALNLLSHGPSLFLLVAYYGVSPWTATACLAIDVLSGSLPFLLLRPLSDAHSDSPSVPNKEVVSDRGIQASTAVLSGSVYSVTLFVASRTYLPTIFVLYFEGIARVEPEAPTGFSAPLAGALMLLFGMAARSFIFTPFAVIGQTAADAETAEFDPVSATLGETIWWNLWGYTTRVKLVVVRTAVLMFLTWTSTYLHCAVAIQGVEPYGAAVYASAWAMAAMLTGLALGVVGDT